MMIERELREGSEAILKLMPNALSIFEQGYLAKDEQGNLGLMSNFNLKFSKWKSLIAEISIIRVKKVYFYYLQKPQYQTRLLLN